MSKRDNPALLVLVLVVTFGLSVAAIWWAHKFGFGVNSGIEYEIEPETENASNKENKSDSDIAKNQNRSPVSLPTPTPSVALNAKDVTGKITYLNNTMSITGESENTLNRLATEISKFPANKFKIKVLCNCGYSDSTRQLGIQRSEYVAGHLRDKGLKHRIIISTRSNSQGNNLSQLKSNKPLEVKLIPN
jgi:outer membrane protein OmpA-like peptidoglycan-associated protein